MEPFKFKTTGGKSITVDAPDFAIAEKRAQQFASVANSQTPKKVDTSVQVAFNPREITTKDLDTKTQTFEPVDMPVDTTAQGILGAIDSMNLRNRTLAESRVKEAESGVQSSLSQLTSSLDRIASRGERQLELEQESKLPDLTDQLADYDSQLDEIDHEYRRKKQAVLNAPGVTANQKQLELNALDREEAFFKADVAVLRNAAQRKYDSAKAWVDRQVDLEFAGEEQRFQLLQTIFSKNFDLFTSREKEMFNANLDAERQRIDFAKEQFTTTQTQKFNALQSASQAGATPDVLNAIWKASSPEEALALAGEVVGTVAREDRALDRANTLSLIAERTKPVGGMGTTFFTNTPPTFEEFLAQKEEENGAPFSEQGIEFLREVYEQEVANNQISNEEQLIGVMRQTAGGKAPVAGERSSLTKAFLVVDQISALQGAITGEQTGPFTSIIRSNNPYDVKAQQIKAQLTQIVPNIARGVFGEVGVLTDADVALYSQTLPNLSSTEDVRNAIMGMTLRTVQRSIENQLEVLAASQIDVSGFEDKYRRLVNTIDNIESQIGISEGGGGEPTDLSDLNFKF